MVVFSERSYWLARKLPKTTKSKVVFLKNDLDLCGKEYLSGELLALLTKFY